MSSFIVDRRDDLDAGVSFMFPYLFHKAPGKLCEAELRDDDRAIVFGDLIHSRQS